MLQKRIKEREAKIKTLKTKRFSASNSSKSVISNLSNVVLTETSEEFPSDEWTNKPQSQADYT